MVRSHTQVVTLDSVIEHYVSSLQLPEGVTVIGYETLIDPVKGKLSLTLTVDENPPEKKPDEPAH